MLVTERADQAEPTEFRVADLLREARRQLGKPSGPIPPVAVLDPDGDLAAYLLRTGRGRLSSTWACYHTRLVEAEVDGVRLGVLPSAVRRPGPEACLPRRFGTLLVVAFPHVSPSMPRAPNPWG
jgi:hypothetical protein